MDSEKKNLWSVTILIVICAAALSFILVKHNLQFLIEKGLHLNGIPLPCNNDSYYFLDQAYSLSERGVRFTGVFSDQRQSILLPYLLSFLAGTDKLLMMGVGSYAGPVLGLFMLLAVLPWGIQSRSPAVMILSSLLALCAPYWLNRTQVGFLDTDSLVPGFCYFALFCVFKFSSVRSRLSIWVATYLGTVFFLWFWWRPGAMFSICFIFLYLIYPSRNRVDTCIKIALLVFVLVVGGLAIGGYSPFAKYMAYVSAHAKLAFGGGSISLLSDSIVELQNISPWDLLRKSYGLPALILPAIYGLFIYILSSRSQGVFLGSTFLFGGVACISQRFIPLFIPAASFFAAYGIVSFCSFICERAEHFFPAVLKKKNAFLLLCGTCILLLSIFNAYRHDLESYFTPEDFVLAKLIRKNTRLDSLVWTWWDYGYFFKFLTGREVLFDGGSQSKATCFLAAYPLIQQDMSVAASWMKYFSVGNIWEKEAYVRNNDLENLLHKIKSASSCKGENAVKPVVLCLPRRVFTTVGYLYSFAYIRNEKVPPVINHLDLFSKNGFAYDASAQTVQVPEAVISKGYNEFGAIIDASNIAVDDLRLDSMTDPYLVYSDKTDFIAVTDRLLVGSVLFRLLGLFENDADQFSKIYFNDNFGGLWLVQ
ncbi:hypothetical protein [Maridesulfovibrio zosterae]|uniref:hypothetical protein n=1 Tax=Maridesulfovibrio zosterae TaxID=82171 RepID=UPI00041D40F2|nr:hypothetical protein [Maridesulfovibrio zosterae]